MLSLKAPRASGPCRCGRSTRSSLRPVARLATGAAVTPSSATAANELQSLGRLSTIVPDTLALDTLTPGAKLAAAVVSAGTLRAVLAGGSLGLKPFENAINAALAVTPTSGSPLALASDPLDRALVNVGAMLTDVVWGRVATEVDPRLADDEAGLVLKVRSLVDLYGALRVPRDRLLFRLPATWAGTQAAHTLETEGIETTVFMVYGMAQGIAAMQAGASAIQVNVGRIRDWYNSHPGVQLNLAVKSPRQNTGLGGSQLGDDPALELVKALYGYSRRFHGGRTAIVATGLRSRQDALALAGCDYLVLPEKVMAALAAEATDQGYNDGLSAVAGGQGVRAVLSPAAADAMDLEKVGPVSQAGWADSLAEDVVATELLASARALRARDVDELAKLIASRITAST